MLIEISADDLANLRELRDAISNLGLTDCGPYDEGWRSDELESAIQALKNLVDRAASPPSTEDAIGAVMREAAETIRNDEDMVWTVDEVAEWLIKFRPKSSAHGINNLTQNR